jgi:hypothetical protein
MRQLSSALAIFACVAFAACDPRHHEGPPAGAPEGPITTIRELLEAIARKQCAILFRCASITGDLRAFFETEAKCVEDDIWQQLEGVFGARRQA